MAYSENRMPLHVILSIVGAGVILIALVAYFIYRHFKKKNKPLAFSGEGYPPYGQNNPHGPIAVDPKKSEYPDDVNERVETPGALPE